MKIKKLPIFLEITKNSFFIIIFILIIYTISQLIAFSIFTNEHEINLINDRYQEVINLSKNINIEFSEKGFNEYLQRLDQGETDEYIRIYSQNKIYYESPSEIWNYVKFDYSYDNTQVKSRFLDSEVYKLITGPIEINNTKYTLQILIEDDLFGEFIEDALPILGVFIILGLILSGIGAMYVSKEFVGRIKELIKTMKMRSRVGICFKTNK